MRWSLASHVRLILVLLIPAVVSGQVRAQTNTGPTSTTAPAEAVRPTLPPDVAEWVVQLDARITDLHQSGANVDLAAAIELAEQVLTIRREHQARWTDTKGEPAEWYEIGDARRTIEHLRLLAAVSPEQRRELRNVDGDVEIEQLYLDGRYDRALSLIRRQLEVRQRILGEHLNVAMSLSSLASILEMKAEYAASEPLYREALALARKLLGEEHPEVAKCINNLAKLLYASGDIAAAESLFRKALMIFRSVYGTEHAEVAHSANDLGSLLCDKNDYGAAEPLLREALSVCRKIYGDDDPQLAASLNNLALLLKRKGEYACAEPLYRESLAICRKAHGSNHPYVATSLNNVGVLLCNSGDFVGAKSLYREALQIYYNLHGARHPSVALSLNNLASVLHELGDYAGAEPLYREALVINRRVYGSQHPTVALSLNNLAALLDERGDITSAESLYREALTIYRSVHGHEHTSVATILDNLALLLVRKADYGTADMFCREALAVRRRLLGSEHPSVVTTINNLAFVRYSAADPFTAERLLREALAVARNVYGDEHPCVGRGLNNLAVLLRGKGDHAAAEQVSREALVAWRMTYDDNHQNVVRARINLSAVLYDKGDYPSAEALLLKAAEAYEATRLRVSARGGMARALFQPGDSPLPLLVAVHARRGSHQDAWRRLESHFARGLLDEIALRQSRPLADEERERESRLNGQLNRLDEQISSLLGRPDSTDREELLSKLQGEREILQAELLQFAAAMQDKYGAAAGDVYELQRIQRAMPEDAALLTWLDIKGEPHAANLNGEHWACIVRNTGDPIWVELRGSGTDGRWTRDDDLLPTRVAELVRMEATVTLPPDLEIPDSAALCRQKVDIHGRTLIARNHGPSGPTKDDLLSLSKAESWRVAVEALRIRAAQIGDKNVLQELTSRLRAQRVTPLKPHLRGVRRLLILPAGWLARVPIEIAVGEYAISYAPSATMYAWLKEKRNQGDEGSTDQGVGSLLALGDPVFEQPGTDEPTESPTPPKHGVLVISVVAKSNAARSGVKDGDVLLTYGGTKLSGSTDLGLAIQRVATEADDENSRGSTGVPVRVWRNGKTVDLELAPGRMGVRTSQRPAAKAIEIRRELDRAVATRGEVNAIRGLFGFEGDHLVLLGSDASEQRLAELAESGRLKSFRYLHFATHGVLDDVRAMRSALILSQDNLPDPYKRALTDEEVFDGRLTAEQIVRTWKLDADLVTLSACQTALGKQVGGEGFLGFSQALFVAGARSLVLSLWKVDDLATMLLMQRFYENLLGRYDDARSTPGREFPAGTPLPKVEALREAKRAIGAMTWDQAKRRSGKTEDEFARYRAARGGFGTTTAPRGEFKQGLPFDHPYYWAGFILMGNPE